MDSALSARLESIAEGLGQIAELRAEVEGLRTLVEKLVQTVSAMIPEGQTETGAPEQAAPAATEEVQVIETYNVSVAAEEEPELVAQD